MNEITQNFTSLADLRKDLHGFNEVKREKAQQAQQVRVGECVSMWADLMEGKIDPFFLKEALNPSIEGFTVLHKRYPAIFHEEMSTSDFASLTVDVLDRQLIANFEAAKPVYQSIARVSPNLRDFRQVKRIRIDGGQDQARTKAEWQGLRASSPKVETTDTYTPLAYINSDSWSWEAAINDDLGIFTDLPQRLSNGHIAAVSRFFTGLYVTTTGPDTSLYHADFNNIINTTNGAATTNPALSVTGLNDALTVLRKQVNSDNEPVMFNGRLTLVVPNALEVTANNIMNQLTVDSTGVGGSSTQTIRVNNWIVERFEVVVDPWIDKIATSNQNTSWFVFVNPTQNRPAIEMGFLRGFQQPQLFQKVGNTARVGGGIDQAMGDFNDMGQEIKALTVFGGTVLEEKSTVASNGSGS
jgi:hypothetical protein